MTEDAFLATFILYAIAFVVLIILRLGAVAVDMSLILQITYVILINQTFIETNLYGLIKIGKMTTGYNIMLS
jgi:hypothetical protein